MLGLLAGLRLRSLFLVPELTAGFAGCLTDPGMEAVDKVLSGVEVPEVPLTREAITSCVVLPIGDRSATGLLTGGLLRTCLRHQQE